MNDIKFQDWQLVKAGKAVRAALKQAGDAGMSRDDVEKVIKNNLKVQQVPTGQSFGVVMFTAGSKNVDGRYYARGKGPAKNSKPESASGKSHDGQSVTFEGDEIVVTVKGSGHDFKSKAVKVVVFFSALIGVFWMVNMAF